jgi:hypothetical protein
MAPGALVGAVGDLNGGAAPFAHLTTASDESTRS